MPGRSQFRTAVILIVLILCCLGVVYYFRTQDKTPEPASAGTTLAPVSQGLEEALSRFDNAGEQDRASLLTSIEKSVGRKAELVFWGLYEESMIREIISALDESGISSTFFITEADVAKYPQSLQLIAESRYPVGIAYSGTANVAGKTAAKRAVSDFVRLSGSIQLLTGLQPSAVLTLEAPDNSLLAAAYASYLYTVMIPAKTVTLSSAASQQNPGILLNDLPRGSILCIQLNGLTRSGLDYVRQLSAALAQTDFSVNVKSLLASSYAPAQEQMRVYTTERAAAFTFSNLDNEEELNGVLDVLDSLDAKATFFVSAKDLVQNSSRVRAVISRGHALGIASQPVGNASAEAILVELLQIKETLSSEYAYSRPLPIRPVYGGFSAALRQACGAGGFTLISAITNVVKPEDLRETDPSAVLAKRFPEVNGPLQRGHIVHFEMNQYQYSNRLLGDLVRLIATEKNIYPIKPVMDILQNQQYTYTYPLRSESILPEVRDAIHPGQLTGDPLTAIQSRYIGISWINSVSFLPGFTSNEIKKLDKRGLITGAQNAVYLTFDDWGTDKTVTALLDLLRNYNVKATFFVRTENVIYNPNLLRAIALEGHSIGSHTRTHYPLANDTGNGKKFTELSATQVAELKQDLVDSYQDLQSIIGDISVNGRPALTRLFRPPTLAVSKSGLAAVLDSGYTYSVSGYFTSQDYKTTDPNKLAASLKANTVNGAVLIMHISDASVHTVSALELYLNEMGKRTPDKSFRFISLGEVLN